MKSQSFLTACLIILCLAGAAFGQSGTCSGMSVGQLSNLNGYVPFPSSSLWNTDISTAPVDPNSANIINYIGSTTTLHADFGSGTYNSSTIGIPYQVVPGTQSKVSIVLKAYASESDPGPMPIPSKALIEGYPKPGNGDRHVLVLDKDACWLYELYHASVNKNGSWNADSAAVWDMTINEQRPYLWGSADAAGLPIFPGLVRYDEVAAGAIDHALRFTVPSTQQAFVAPASHWASTVTNPNAPPMGTRLRLNANFDISAYPPEDQVILTALKKYGMILADNGSGIFISGAPNSNWNNTNLNKLKTVTAADFDVVQMGTIYTSANVPQGAAPTISAFSGNPMSVATGQPVTLTWSTNGALYTIISPQIGTVRGNSIIVTPSATTTYTIYATNQYGQTKQSLTISVQ